MKEVESFEEMLEKAVCDGQMTPEQRDDLLEQRDHFNEHRAEIEQQFHGQVVGYVNGNRMVGTVYEILDRARERFPGRMVYFEPIGFLLIEAMER